MNLIGKVYKIHSILKFELAYKILLLVSRFSKIFKAYLWKNNVNCFVLSKLFRFGCHVYQSNYIHFRHVYEYLLYRQVNINVSSKLLS